MDKDFLVDIFMITLYGVYCDILIKKSYKPLENYDMILFSLYLRTSDTQSSFQYMKLTI